MARQSRQWRRLSMKAMRWFHDEMGINDFHNIDDKLMMKAINRHYPGGWVEFLSDM